MSSIRNALADAPRGARRFLRGATADVCLGDIVHGTSLGGVCSELCRPLGAVATRDQLAAALALIELDGVARRLIVCTPDLRAEYLSRDHRQGRRRCDRVRPRLRRSTDRARRPLRSPCVLGARRRRRRADRSPADRMGAAHLRHDRRAEDGVHTLASLTGAITGGEHEAADVVWGTFYDIRRYGGLQIFLRAILGGGSLVLSERGRADRRLPRARSARTA